MLRTGVELPAAFTSAGEFLADVQAYEAAGADVIWLGPQGAETPSLEPLTLLAAAAAVTYRARLGARLRPEWPGALLADVVTTLQRLGRGRTVLGVETAPAAAGGMTVALRAAGARVLMCGGDLDDGMLGRAAQLGDGFLRLGGGTGEAAVQFRRLRELRPESKREAGATDEFELWARVPAPGGRAEWRDLTAAYEAAGATGVIVAHAPNLLDILRNPQEDDRQDLAIAVG